MAIGTFLTRRGDTYSFRCRMPARARSLIKRRDVVKGLRTRDSSTARFLAAVIATRIDELVSSMADHRLDELAAMVRAGDHRAGHDPAREILGRWTRR